MTRARSPASVRLPGVVVMRQLARPLMLLAAILGCTPDTRTDAERLAAAARADSSAAGYDVGRLDSGRHLAVARRDSTPGRPAGASREPDTRTPGDSQTSRPARTDTQPTAAGPTGSRPITGPSRGPDTSAGRSSGSGVRGRDSTV